MTKNHYIYFDNICSELTLSFFNFCFYFENRENLGERVENFFSKDVAPRLASNDLGYHGSPTSTGQEPSVFDKGQFLDVE